MNDFDNAPQIHLLAQEIARLSRSQADWNAIRFRLHRIAAQLDDIADSVRRDEKMIEDLAEDAQESMRQMDQAHVFGPTINLIWPRPARSPFPRPPSSPSPTAA
jgi:hypothetical protein